MGVGEDGRGAEWNGEGVWNLPPGYQGASKGLEAKEFCDDICALGRSLWQVCGGMGQCSQQLLSRKTIVTWARAGQWEGEEVKSGQMFQRQNGQGW